MQCPGWREALCLPLPQLMSLFMVACWLEGLQCLRLVQAYIKQALNQLLWDVAWNADKGFSADGSGEAQPLKGGLQMCLTASLWSVKGEGLSSVHTAHSTPGGV